MALLFTRDDLRPVFVRLEAWQGMIDALEAAYASAPAQPSAGARPQLRVAAGDGPRMAVVASTAVAHGISVLSGPDPQADGALQSPEVLPLFDRERHLEAILAGGDFNLLRVAASTLAAAQILAPKDPRRVAIFGSGFEGRAHLPFARKLFPGLQEVRVYSPTAGHREAFAQQVAPRRDIPVTAVSSGAEAVEGADLVLAVADARAGLPAAGSEARGAGGSDRPGADSGAAGEPLAADRVAAAPPQPGEWPNPRGPAGRKRG